jgi:hypothetical protein
METTTQMMMVQSTEVSMVYGSSDRRRGLMPIEEDGTVDGRNEGTLTEG